MSSIDDTVRTTHESRARRCGAYVLGRALGQGGTGAVWEARHAVLGRRVAVKLMRPEFARNPEMLARFLREAVAAARVEHPAVAAVLDAGHDGVEAWIAMEYLDGEDLKALLDRETRLDPARAVDLLLPVLAGVAVAHDVGVVHRDLKPGNVFLARGRDGAVAPKVIDFGFSKLHDASVGGVSDLTAPATAVGTLWYMPVEQIRASSAATPACDQYALGVTLYRMVTGALPFAGRTDPETFSAIVRGQCTRPSALVPSLPPGLEEVILRAMAHTPDKRFESVRAFGAALLPFAGTTVRRRWADSFNGGAESPEDTRIAAPNALPPAPAPKPPSTPPAPPQGRARVWVALAVGLVAGAAAGAGVVLALRS